MANMKFGLVGRILTILAAIVVIVAGMAWIGNAQDRAKEPQKLEVAANDNDWFEGGKDASVVLVEYSDFQCPACGAYFPVMKGLQEAYGDKLKIVYRNYPLASIHANAQLAAQAAEAAGIQEQFFLMHDLLFGNQQTWSTETDPTNTFIGYATSIGLDVEKFKTDLTSDEAFESVKDDIRSGDKSNVDSTPTFFLNGVRIEKNPQGLEPFKVLIDAALPPTPVADPATSSIEVTTTP
ncbi:MAG: thioredoxin domain-containing protein [Patescibacteria group bacterium]